MTTIPAISPPATTAPVVTLIAAPIVAARQAISASEDSPAQIRADSLRIANLYGSTAAIVIQTAPVVNQTFNSRPELISPVTKLTRLIAPRNATANIVDRYA